MSTLKYFCCQERRRAAVKTHPSLNGIDFLEVDDPGEPDPTAPPAEQALQRQWRQRRLFVHLLKEIAADQLTSKNVAIEGGERITPIRITRVATVDSGSLPGKPVLMVEVAEPGDFSTYTLRLVDEEDEGKPDPPPPAGFDPILSAVDFSFKAACPGDFDCQRCATCVPETAAEPEIDYLAKDYATFRQLVLDRLAVVTPLWKQRLPADLGVGLVELLAYVADYLSYRQDAVATEAYLRTARRRTSVRRHARLVDYRMHEGCNARVWVHLKVRTDVTALPLRVEFNGQRTRFFTRTTVGAADTAAALKLGDAACEAALDQGPEVFEPLHEITLEADHNELRFHTWGNAECCLPKGAVRATLAGSHPHLQPGDVLILQEVKGPQTGQAEDADPTRRHAVRLVAVTASTDPLGDELASPLTALAVTEIEWHEEDALPFPFCVSAPGVADVSVARGNIVLTDHGLTVEPEDLPAVPDANPVLNKVSETSPGHCEEVEAETTPPRYRPRLQSQARARAVENRRLTYAPPFVWDAPPYATGQSPTSARACLEISAADALPQVTLTEEGKPDVWEAVWDLLGSGPERKKFVIETENDGSAYLRFGDDQFGSRPASGAQLTARYRAGMGLRGNVGAEAICRIASADPALVSDALNPVVEQVSNPLPAAGGAEPERLEEVRQQAPAAFRTQERAVTLDDYVEMAGRCDAGLQSAAAVSRWTGSWHTVFLTVDRLAGKTPDAPYQDALKRCLEKYRLASQDLEISPPRSVPLELEMLICVKPEYYREAVKTALLERFSNRVLADGSKGLLHPDQFRLGQTVYLSPFYEAAQNVAGVASVNITRFQRQDHPSSKPREEGKLELDRSEVARLDNDPNYPERGRFVLQLQGGK
jgi:hypothetical protein